MTDRPTLSAAIIDARSKKGMSQIDLVAAADGRFSAGYIAMIEAGHRTPSPHMLDAIADAMALSKRERVELHRLRDLVGSSRRLPRSLRDDGNAVVPVSRLAAVADKYSRLSSAQRVAIDRVLDAFLE